MSFKAKKARFLRAFLANNPVVVEAPKEEPVFVVVTKEEPKETEPEEVPVNTEPVEEKKTPGKPGRPAKK